MEKKRRLFFKKKNKTNRKKEKRLSLDKAEKLKESRALLANASATTLQYVPEHIAHLLLFDSP